MYNCYVFYSEINYLYGLTLVFQKGFNFVTKTMPVYNCY